MELLFDIAPEEPVRKRSARAHQKQPEATEPCLIRAIPKIHVVPPLGRLDDVVACIDQSCQTSCHDIVSEDDGRWFLECCFCGTGQWVKVIPGHLKPRAEQFVFRDGRFGGLTLDEAAAQPRGLDYIEWAAKEHKRPAVRTACGIWLDARGPRP